MKNKLVYLFIGLFLLQFCFTGYCSDRTGNQTEINTKNASGQQLRILSTPDLYALTKMWAGEYGRLHPEVNIEAVQMTEFQKKDVIEKKTDLFLVSDSYITAFSDDAIWKLVIGREVIVPVVSSENPFRDEIQKQGISPDELAGIANDKEKPVWGMLLGNSQSAPVHFYMINNGSIRSNVAQFLGRDPLMIDGISIGNRKEMLSAIQKDPYGIGFFRMTDLVDPENQGMVANITFLPLDKNNNGHLEYFEKIYSDLNVFARGVWIGKYPKALCTTIYSISSAKPSNYAELAFLSWLVTDGQQFLNPVGYKDLAGSDRQLKKAAMLQGSQPGVSNATNFFFFTDKLHDLSLFSLIMIAIIPFILAFMIGDAVIRYKRHKRVEIHGIQAVSSGVFDENSVDVPGGLFFDKTHMWAFMEKNGMVRIGIDDFLQHVTGPLTGIKMKDIGEKVKKGEHLLSIIQNGKQLTILAPVSGIIKSQNLALINNTSVMNTSPYSEGWVYLVEPTKWLSEIRFLTMAEKYQEWLKKEFARLKDFIAVSVKTNNADFAHIILQDGGELKDGVLSDLGPKEWEDFQIHFIDRSR